MRAALNQGSLMHHIQKLQGIGVLQDPGDAPFDERAALIPVSVTSVLDFQGSSGPLWGNHKVQSNKGRTKKSGARYRSKPWIPSSEAVF